MSDVEDCGIEAAVSGEIFQRGGPGGGIEALLERVAGRRTVGRHDVGEGFEGFEEGGVAGIFDEVYGAPAAGFGEMIEACLSG